MGVKWRKLFGQLLLHVLLGLLYKCISTNLNCLEIKSVLGLNYVGWL